MSGSLFGLDWDYVEEERNKEISVNTEKEKVLKQVDTARELDHTLSKESLDRFKNVFYKYYNSFYSKSILQIWCRPQDKLQPSLLSNPSLIMVCYLNRYHCGRFGFIHGGASYYITYLASQLLSERLGCSANSISKLIKYKKKLPINSYCFVEAFYHVSQADTKKSIIIEIHLKDYSSQDCVVSIFEYTDKKPSF